MIAFRQLTFPTSTEIHRIATAWHKEWHEREDHWSYEETYCYTAHLCQANRLPIMVVAELDNMIVGAVAIATSDLHVRPDIYPDIINLYVWPEYRNQGIGRQLLDKACEILFKITDYDSIFLYTELDELYEKFGWKFDGKIDTVYLAPRLQNLYHKDRPQEMEDNG